PTSCAATGAGAMRFASPRIAPVTSPSRVIVSPSAATLLVDLDVPACEHAAFGHHVVRDPEHVIAFAGIPMVLYVRHEPGRVAVRAAATREVRRGGGDRDGADRAIEVRARDMVQVIQMAARSLLRIKAEGGLAAHQVGLDLAATRCTAGRGQRTGTAAGRLPRRMERAAIHGQVLDLVDDEPAVRVAAEAGHILLVVDRPAGHYAAVQLPHRHVDGEVRVAADCGQMEVVLEDVPA